MQRAKTGTYSLLIVLLAGTAWGADIEAGGKLSITAVDHQRRTIYRSPQKPSYVCWVGAWLAPDDSLMVCFTQATGPLKGRPTTPEALQKKLAWPPKDHSSSYDMTGLDMRNVYLRSTDGGKTWTKVSADAFASPFNGISSNCGQLALADGTVVRNVWGQYLCYNEALPKTGYLQRSHDGTKTWGPPEVFLDPKKVTLWPKQLRVLGDGRLMMLGALSHAPAESLPNRLEYYAQGRIEPIILVSEDSGKTWSDPIHLLSPEALKTWRGIVEWDAVELPNGDLFCVHRRHGPYGQQLLKKDGNTWIPGKITDFPLTNVGKPCLLRTREGVLLHFGYVNVFGSLDDGKSWRRLEGLPGYSGISSIHYYPVAVQTADGCVFMFGHAGGYDAPYGTEMSIVMERFRPCVSESNRVNTAD